MPRVALELNFASENLRQISPNGDDPCWTLKLKCTSCGEASDNWHDITEEDKVDMPGGRGKASFVCKCKLCAQHYSLDIVPKSVKAYDCSAGEQWQKVVVFECRGVEPVDYCPTSGWFAISSESDTKFDPVVIDHNEWIDYDEVAKVRVVIEDVKHRFVKV